MDRKFQYASLYFYPYLLNQYILKMTKYTVNYFLSKMLGTRTDIFIDVTKFRMSNQDIRDTLQCETWGAPT